MSSNTKDPLEKQGTSIKSDESEKEVEKAEGNLEQLKIVEKDNSDESKAADQEDASSSSDDLFNKIYAEQRGIEKAEGNLELLKIAKKDDYDESKATDSANQEGRSTRRDDLFDKIYAEQRGHQKSHPHGSSDPEGKVACSTDPSKEKKLETKGIDENIGTQTVEESHETGKKDLKATDCENFPVRMEEEDADYARSTPLICKSGTGVSPTSMLQEVSSATAPSGPRIEYDDAIPLALADPVRSRSPPRSSSSRGFDDSTTENENTLADVSEIDSEVAEMSREGNVHQDATETINKKESAVERQSPESSDTDISEIQDFVPPPNPESSSLQCIAPPPTPESSSLQVIAPPPTPVSSIGSTPKLSGMLESESMEEPISGHERMEVCERPLEQEQQNIEHVEEMNVSEEARKRTSASIMPAHKSVEVFEGEGSPYKRRRPSIEVGDSITEEKGIAYRLRSRTKQDAEKKCKMATRKSSDLHSTSESPEPKSSSSDEFILKDFPKGKSMTLNIERGLFPSTQQSKVFSKDSLMPQPSALREQGPQTMETEDTTFVKMETTAGEGADELMEPLETKPSTSSACGSGGILKEGEQSIGDFEYEGSVEKSKQELELKGRSNIEPTCRTRQDSVDPDMRVDLGNPQQSGSTSPRDVSDISTISPNEEETKV